MKTFDDRIEHRAIVYANSLEDCMDKARHEKVRSNAVYVIVKHNDTWFALYWVELSNVDRYIAGMRRKDKRIKKAWAGRSDAYGRLTIKNPIDQQPLI